MAIVGDIPSITVTGIPITPIQNGASAASGDTSWMDRLFGVLERGGSAYLDYELQSRTIDDNLRRQQQYGNLYSSPGSFFPMTGQGPNGQTTINPQFLMIALVVVGLGVAAYAVAK